MTQTWPQPLTLTLEQQEPPGVVAMTSLPWPRGETRWPRAREVTSQAVPLFDPEAPPSLKRFLLLAESRNGNLPPEITMEPAASTVQENARTQVEIISVKEGEYPYYHREDEARFSVRDRTIGLRLGLQLDDGLSWWQWARAELLWSGPVADAWRIGGHIVTRTLKSFPAIAPGTSVEEMMAHRGLNMFDAMAEFGGWQIAADVFVLVFHCGLLQITAHFKNNYFMVPPEDVPGLPVIALTGLHGHFGERQLHGGETRVDGGAGDCFDFSGCRRYFSDAHPGLLYEDEGKVLLRPFERMEILSHKTKENKFLYLGEPHQKGLPAGVARSIRLSLGLNHQNPHVARYAAPADWYGQCGVFNGRAQQAATGQAHQWAARSRDAIYQNTHSGGFDTGRVWRYLRRDIRGGVPQVDDAEWEGGTAQALLLDAYLRPETAGRDLILHQIYHYADIAVHHGHMMVRCHGYNTPHFPLPMMRAGGLVLGYAETGDPYLLETARWVADTFMRMEETNQPRYSIGRDAYPLAGLMTLYDYTNDRRYLDFGRKLAVRLLATQTASGGFSGQGNVGIGGKSNLWEERDIFIFSGLLAPIALLEWALRDNRHPPGFREQMGKWFELVLSFQTAQGWWPQDPEGARSYALLPAGLLFSLSAYHRLFGDKRGLAALQRYLDYALAQKEFTLGTHSFLAVLYASFYEMEKAG